MQNKPTTALLLLALAFMINPAADARAAAASPAPPAEWKMLAALPDPVGYAGMFGGVLQGRLVTGGGSQWDKPGWLNGTKNYRDRIFALTDPAGKWTELRAKVPFKGGYFASASTAEAIYLAGGIDSTGCRRSVFKLRTQGEELIFDRLPDLPKPVGYGAAAIAGGRLYVVGGMDSPEAKSARVETWSLAIAGPSTSEGWRREADFPGTGVFVASAAADAGQVYVFGGMEFTAAGKYAPSAHAYRLNAAVGKWEPLPDLPEPRVGGTNPGRALADGRLFLVGGYAEIFPGKPRDHPGFSTQTLFYNIRERRWERGPILPHAAVANRDSPGDAGPAPMLAAPCVLWQDRVVVIGGEVRSGVRTPAVLAWSVATGSEAKK
jgi:N-acetylneuraminate epimerase